MYIKYEILVLNIIKTYVIYIKLGINVIYLVLFRFFLVLLKICN